MSMWQFLIQREGDRAWLPIEAGGEIPEGRYRLAARTSYVNTPVVVEIIYVEKTEQPQPKMQRRACQTNTSGLLMVFPYSKIPIGTLTIRCLVHTKAALQNYAIQFHIVSQDLNERSSWDNWQLSTPDRTKATCGDEQRMLLENFAEKCISSAQLQVTSETLMATKGEPLLIEGHMQLEAEQAGIGQSWQGRLRVTLYDPQTATASIQQDCPVHTTVLAPVMRLPFQYPVLIPDQVTTHVLLAELALHNANDAPTAEPLATASLVVTVNWQDLLTVLHNSSTEGSECLSTESPEPPVPEQTVKRPLDLTFVSMLSSSKLASQPQQLASQSTMTTAKPSSPRSEAWQPVTLPAFPPPVITATKSSSSRSEAWQAVTLPTFPPSVRVTQADEGAQEQGPEQAVSDELLTMLDNLANLDESDGVTNDRPSSTPDATLDGGTLDANKDAVSSESESDATTPSAPDATLDANEDAVSSGPESNATVPSTTSELESDAIAPAFRSLNLHQRFWTRLHNLVGDVELANWLAPVTCPEAYPAVDAENISQPAVDQPPVTTSSDSQPNLQEQSTKQVNGEDIWLSHEIVVDDDFCLPDRRNPTLSSSPQFIIPDDQPIPEPMLHVPEGEWIAGKSIPIRITIPDTGAQLCVKQWFFDYETRSVLGEPQWLVNFMPDGYGRLEAMTYVTVPLGSLEVRLAAIVVEIPTQRESYPASVDRRVVPADLPTVSLELLSV